MKGDVEKELLTCSVLSDLLERVSEASQLTLERGMQRRRTRPAVKVCDLPRGDRQLVRGSKTSVSRRAVEIPTGEYFHSLSMKNKRE